MREPPPGLRVPASESRILPPRGQKTSVTIGQEGSGASGGVGRSGRGLSGTRRRSIEDTPGGSDRDRCRPREWLLSWRSEGWRSAPPPAVVPGRERCPRPVRRLVPGQERGRPAGAGLWTCEKVPGVLARPFRARRQVSARLCRWVFRRRDSDLHKLRTLLHGSRPQFGSSRARPGASGRRRASLGGGPGGPRSRLYSPRNAALTRHAVAGPSSPRDASGSIG
jgi:hypothetical protein